MSTLEDTKKKPKILTESDIIIDDFKNELLDLKHRVVTLEKEQIENKELLSKYHFDEELADELLRSYSEESKITGENFTVVASVINNLKFPVSEVVSNLEDIIGEIQDEETQESLRDVVNTASTVLASFNEVEKFCQDVGEKNYGTKAQIDVREFLRSNIATIQNDSALAIRHKFRLLIDKNVPTECLVDQQIIKESLRTVLAELNRSANDSTIKIIISTKSRGEKYGIELTDLLIRIELESKTDILWPGNWPEMIKANQTISPQYGLNLVKVKNSLHHFGGELEVLANDNKIKGFAISFPLVY